MRVIVRTLVIFAAAAALAISGASHPAPAHMERVAYPPICC